MASNVSSPIKTFKVSCVKANLKDGVMLEKCFVSSTFERKKTYPYIKLIAYKNFCIKKFFIASKLLCLAVPLALHLYVWSTRFGIGALWVGKRLKSMRQVVKSAVLVNSLPSSPSNGKPIVISDKHQFVKLCTRLDSWGERFLVMRFRKSLFLVWKSQLFLHILEGDV